MSLSKSMPMPAPRYQPHNRNLTANIKFLNANLSYQMKIENFSLTGLLISWEHDAMLPFTDSMTLKFCIDKAGKVCDFPIECIGKVIRSFQCKQSKKMKFGIQILNMDATNYDRWMGLIDQANMKVAS